MKNARALLEFAKAAGFADIASGVRVATREFLRGQMKRLPHVLEIGPGHKIEPFKNVSFEIAPYWFFIEPEAEGGQVQFYSASSEQNALMAIEAAAALGRNAP
jgi:hypothetical protein